MSSENKEILEQWESLRPEMEFFLEDTRKLRIPNSVIRDRILKRLRDNIDDVENEIAGICRVQERALYRDLLALGKSKGYCLINEGNSIHIIPNDTNNKRACSIIWSLENIQTAMKWLEEDK